MRLVSGLMLIFCAVGVRAEQQYYQADPARLAQLEAERCQRLLKESSLIRQRLTRPVGRPADAERMKTRLQSLNASAVKYCPVADSKSPAAGVKR